MIPVVRALGALVLRGLLPYPDLIRRRRVRTAARRLVVCEPWPADDDAITGLDAAQLALLRLLWLQKQTRRAVRGRHREAAVLLARSSLEACILGLYCVHCPEPVTRLRAAHLKAGTKMMAFLDAVDVIPQEVIKQAVDELGPQRKERTVREMVELIDAETGGTVMTDLYDRLYAPTSAYFAHANAASLLRHVKAGGTLASNPTVPWARRSPVRLADACVGLLAAAIAHRNGGPSDRFVSYAEAHYARTMPPAVVMMGKGLARSFKPRRAVEAIRMFLNLRRYLAGPALSDPLQVREARVRAAFDKLLTDPDVPAESLRPVVDHLVGKILSELPATTGDEIVSQDER